MAKRKKNNPYDLGEVQKDLEKFMERDSEDIDAEGGVLSYCIQKELEAGHASMVRMLIDTKNRHAQTALLLRLKNNQVVAREALIEFMRFVSEGVAHIIDEMPVSEQVKFDTSLKMATLGREALERLHNSPESITRLQKLTVAEAPQLTHES